MTTYYITFSSRYLTQEHPTLPGVVDPHGYITLEAQTYQEALKKAHNAIGPYYDGIVSSRYFDKGMYPKGCLGVVAND